MPFSSVSVNNSYLLSLFIETRTMTALEKMHCQSDQQQISRCLRLPAIIDQELSDPNAISVARTTPAAIDREKEQKNSWKDGSNGQASFSSLQRYLAVSIPTLFLLFCPTQRKSPKFKLTSFWRFIGQFHSKGMGKLTRMSSDGSIKFIHEIISFEMSCCKKKASDLCVFL